MTAHGNIRPDRSPGEVAQVQLPVIEATDLLGKDDQVLIRLRDQYYTLRKTRQGKLLLTK